MMNHVKIKFLICVSLLATSPGVAQNVGVGTLTPTQKLDIAGNTKFSGALMPSGLAGSTGQALISNGAGNSPFWQSATAGQQMNTVFSTSTLVIDKNSPATLIPGLSQTVNVPTTGAYDVFIYTDGGAQWTGNNLADNKGIQTQLSIWIDGSPVKYTTMIVDNPNNFYAGIRNWCFTHQQSLSSGVHTIEVRAYIANYTMPLKTEVTFAAPNLVGYYLISCLSLALIRK